MDLIKKSKNIIVLTGAGISTSLGIPDFRSKDIGLYTKLEHLGLSDPQEVFDIETFREDPTIFYSVARDILPSTDRFTPTHAFIAMLQNKGKLLTNYSQNIDNIESVAGILPERRYDADADTSSDDDYDSPGVGIMKPDITFFGEQLPDRFSERLTNHDKHLVDLVIVIGTSLKVAPVSEVVPYLPANIPQMYISRTPVSHVNFDVDMLGDCDVVVAELCTRLGWDLDHEMVPKHQVINIKLQDGFTSRHLFSVESDQGIKMD